MSSDLAEPSLTSDDEDDGTGGGVLGGESSEGEAIDKLPREDDAIDDGEDADANAMFHAERTGGVPRALRRKQDPGRAATVSGVPKGPAFAGVAGADDSEFSLTGPSVELYSSTWQDDPEQRKKYGAMEVVESGGQTPGRGGQRAPPLQQEGGLGAAALEWPGTSASSASTASGGRKKRAAAAAAVATTTTVVVEAAAKGAGTSGSAKKRRRRACLADNDAGAGAAASGKNVSLSH